MSPVRRENFGFLDGKPVDKITLDNGKIKVELLTYGGIIKSISVPGSPKDDDIVLGFDSLDGYLGKCGPNPYFGCLVGRVANRIANAQFTLDGQVYNLDKNNGENSLHGGIKGLDKVIWSAVISQSEDNTVHMEYTSPDGDSGYPGELKVKVTYTLSKNNDLDITYKAVTNKNAPVNLTNHTYFNLAGHKSGASGLYKHLVTFNADNITPVDPKNLIPTGDIKSVGGTPFDLRV